MFKLSSTMTNYRVALSKRYLRFIPFFILSSALFLSGCQINQPDELAKLATEAELNNPLWKTHTSEVTKLSQGKYSAKGNFAYLSVDYRQSASFFWEQKTQDEYQLKLLNPLGQTVVSITVDNQLTTLIDDKGKSYTYPNPEDAILDLANMDIPLSQLKLWMLGLPGDATQLSLNNNYQLKSAIYQTNQSEIAWTVNYLNYDYNLKPALPSLLEITQKKGDDTLKIKLKINRWAF